MTKTDDRVIEAMHCLLGMSDQERVSACAHLLKVSLTHALGIDMFDDDAINDFNERMQDFIDEFTAAWGAGDE